MAILILSNVPMITLDRSRSIQTIGHLGIHMQKLTTLLVALALSPASAFATTTVLCGDPAVVNRNHKQASVWLIFETKDSGALFDVAAILKGNEAIVIQARRIGANYFIKLTDPETTISFSKRDVEFCQNDTFSVQLTSSSGTQTYSDCRCYND